MKTLKALAALAVLFIIGIAAVDEPTNDKFKNLQVLPKNITEDSLDNLMISYTENLGVDCNYCHTKDKKADSIIYHSDNKPEKEITRNMMRMTMDINKKYFQFNEIVTADQVQAVTCFTCHKGEPMPSKEKKK